MENEQVQRLIEAGLPGCEARVQGDGRHFEVVVIGEAFAGKALLARQRLVNATVNNHIASGELHALSIKTYTPEEWAQVN